MDDICLCSISDIALRTSSTVMDSPENFDAWHVHIRVEVIWVKRSPERDKTDISQRHNIQPWWGYIILWTYIELSNERCRRVFPFVNKSIHVALHGFPVGNFHFKKVIRTVRPLLLDCVDILLYMYTLYAKSYVLDTSSNVHRLSFERLLLIFSGAMTFHQHWF